MSGVIKDLKRLDVIKHLKNLKISPASDQFKIEFLNFVCEHFKLKLEEIPTDHDIFRDINTIKRYYKACHSKHDFLIKKHEKFLDAYLKIKRVPVVPPANVCILYLSILFFKSHKLLKYLNVIAYLGKGWETT